MSDKLTAAGAKGTFFFNGFVVLLTFVIFFDWCSRAVTTMTVFMTLILLPESSMHIMPVSWFLVTIYINTNLILNVMFQGHMIGDHTWAHADLTTVSVYLLLLTPPAIILTRFTSSLRRRVSIIHRSNYNDSLNQNCSRRCYVPNGRLVWEMKVTLFERMLMRPIYLIPRGIQPYYWYQACIHAATLRQLQRQHQSNCLC